MPEIDTILQFAEALNASDVHLKSGVRPRFRVGGNLREVTEVPVLSANDVDRITAEIMTPDQRAQLDTNYEVDFTYGAEIGRFRCAYFHDHWGPGAVYRRIPSRIATLQELGMPNGIAQFAHLHRGLMLITGSTGSGKTATMASLLDIINERYHKHIITLEDPIEYLHKDRLGVIHQRGLHDDFEDFGSGIIAAMRQDPDILVIGEMRDEESIRHALTAAETGILVFGTLHTNGAAESIDRVIDAFPAAEQSQVRVQLSESLAGVVSQVLLHRADSPGRIPATEVLVATPAVASLIRDGKTQDIANVIQGGRSRGMHTLDESLVDLVRQHVVTSKEAALHARNKGRFEESPYKRRSGAALRQ
jgi:twitching motility protein PilT